MGKQVRRAEQDGRSLLKTIVVWSLRVVHIMPTAQETLEFKVSDFNIVAATLGGFLTVFGLVSYLLKEKFYLGEACMPS